MANRVESGMETGFSSHPKDQVEDAMPSRTPSATRVRPVMLATDLREDDSDAVSGEEQLELDDITDEDAQSLIEVSISRAATRLMSPTTPATEKAAAMDDLDDGGLFPSDEDSAPPPEPTDTNDPIVLEKQEHPKPAPVTAELIPSFGTPLPQEPPDHGFPTPWISSPKPFPLERPEETRSSLRGAFDVTKRRSFSGGADALKKLFPSMPKAGNLIPSLPATSFFSSNGNQRTRNRGFSLYRDIAASFSSSEAAGIPSPSPPARSPEHRTGNRNPSNMDGDLPSGAQISSLRRSASDDSLLYHSLSRASSLGDDARFENHHEMINSRAKAIRDSLQDRSSFKLPALPSMPRVPSFSSAMNFTFNLSSIVPPVNGRGNANPSKDILPGSPRRRLSAAPNLAIAPGMVGASISKPDVVIKTAGLMTEGPNNSNLERAMANMTGDVIIMGGYRGSILRSSKPPHRQLWVPMKVGLNIRKVNMEVGLEPEDEERMEEHMFASGMIQNIGPVDISRRLFKRLRESENARNGKLRIWDYGYDWRLSPHLLSRKLIKFVEELPSNQRGVADPDKGALVIAHSLGGLITRHAVNQCPELFSGVVYAGVPQSCVNILGPLRNGDAVLLSSRVLTAQVNFTLRTSFVLLPLEGYCFIDKATREEYTVDFFNADDWIKYRWSPCTDPPLPPKSQPTGGLANMLRQGSLTNLALPGKKVSNAGLKRPTQTQTSSASSIGSASDTQAPHSKPLATREADAIRDVEGTDRTLAPQMGNLSNPVKRGQSTNTSVSTTVTIPRDKAIGYLRRTLAEVKQFKMELAHDQKHTANNRYPPFAIIYGKSVPTVYAARVDGRDGIACADCYDDLAFASGDGVCLSREAMLPQGYHLVKGGRISSDRGHVTLLGDLNAVGKAIQAVGRGRSKGMGLGL